MRVGDSSRRCEENVKKSQIAPLNAIIIIMGWMSSRKVQVIGVLNISTRGVMVSTPAFLTCHQSYSAGSSRGWDLNFRALVCGIC